MYDELIKALRCCGSEDRCKGCPRENAKTKCYDDICIEAADAIEELSKPRWIPVTERVPEDGQDILAVQSWGGEVRIVPTNYDRGVWYDCCFDCVAEHITHWMPLPEPPKEET